MPKQIGWSQESNLLYDILMQLDRLLTVAGGGGGGLLIYPTLAAFPPVGDPAFIYLAQDTNKIYYWDVGTLSYVEMSAGLTSVGLTMPSAFTVTNSPLTSNGTIAVTGAGVVSQYVRGDGSLSDFPGSIGGGSSVNYYINGGTNQGVFGGNTYYQMSKVADTGAGVTFSVGADGYVAQFITDVADPSLVNIPGGSWNVQFYFNASSAGGSPSFYVELYKYDGAVFTLLGSSSGSPEMITGGTSIDLYYTSVSIPTTPLLITDRLAVRIYVTASGKTITLHTQNGTLGLITTTFTTGLTALNGLTAQVQFFATGTAGTDFGITSSGATHTFDLPIASATNTGKLAACDWTKFSNNVEVLGAGTCSTVRCGVNNTASGVYSASLSGFCNTASGTYSVVLGGYNNSATDYFATVSNGYGSTASGCYSTVSGGYLSVASGSYSSASGYSVIASGYGSRATGYSTCATGFYSTASGYCVTASGGYASAHGQSNIASDAYTTINNGYGNTASAYASTVSNGACNTASGCFSTASGYCNIASGIYNLILNGSHNTTSNAYSTIVNGGCNTVTSTTTYGYSTISGGYCNTISARYSFLGGGFGNTASAPYSVIISGYCNTVEATSDNSMIGVGLCNCICCSTYSSVTSGCQNFLVSSNYSAIVGGCCNIISTAAGSENSFIGGGGCNIIVANSKNSLVAGGFNNSIVGNTVDCNSVIVGGNTNNIYDSPYSFVGGGSFNSPAESCFSSVVGGYYNRICCGSCYSSILGGWQNAITCSGSYSAIITGCNNTVSSYSAVILNGICNYIDVCGGGAVVSGFYSKAYMPAQVVSSSGSFNGIQGNNQQSMLTAFNTTSSLSSGGQADLILSGYAPIVPYGSDRVWGVEINTVGTVRATFGVTTGVSVGDSFSQTDFLLFKKVAGTSYLVGCTANHKIYDTSLSTSCISYSVGASQDLKVCYTNATFAGGGATCVQMTSRLHISEVAY